MMMTVTTMVAMMAVMTAPTPSLRLSAEDKDGRTCSMRLAADTLMRPLLIPSTAAGPTPTSLMTMTMLCKAAAEVIQPVLHSTRSRTPGEHGGEMMASSTSLLRMEMVL